MIKPNPRGYHTALTLSVHDEIINATESVLVPSQVAAYCRIPKSTFNSWLARGRKETKEGKNTIYTQLLADFDAARASRVKYMLERLMQESENYKPLTWVLERCFRSDFGSDSEELRELRALFNQILPTLTGKHHGQKEGDEEGLIEARDED